MFPLLLLSSLFSLAFSATDQFCYQCASPGLQYGWQMTALPKKPADLQFTSTCFDLTGAQVLEDAKKEKLAVETCSSSCFSLIIPTVTGFELVRGCHANFVDTAPEQQVPFQTNCSYAPISGFQVPVTKIDGTIEMKAAYSVVDYCLIEDLNDQGHACNRISPTNLNDGIFQGKKCSQIQPKRCYNCARLDGKGKCGKKDGGESSGPVCTKIDGKINGRKYTERSSSLIPPYVTPSLCVWMDSNMTYYTGMGLGATATRTKRNVNQIFSGVQCFCRDEWCNSSPSLIGLVSTLVALLSASSFF